MKNKYITNDLVIYKHELYKVVGPTILTGIWKEDTIPMYNIIPISNEGQAAIVKEEALEGVCISTEILEKNGWSKISPYIDLGNYRHLLYLFYVSEDNTYLLTLEDWVRGYKFDLKIQIKYVHELQHIIFGFGSELLI